MSRQYVITDDEHGYLKAWPPSIGSYLIIEAFCTPEAGQALRYRTQRAAATARDAHGLHASTWRVVPIAIVEGVNP